MALGLWLLPWPFLQSLLITRAHILPLSYSLSILLIHPLVSRHPLLITVGKWNEFYFSFFTR